uniref:FAD-dependent oxidoreductase n=1 Tax=Thermosporothrix sp. COM3 TaxID=2490863 RepID=A0A455SHT8_9CHLR|nr:FAD-dependent oxidoreductase [Thermosporothrix sp. COM3]
MRRQRRKALIIGGGIAGPAVALLLQRAGIEAEIYEARTAPNDNAGSFLNTACNGLEVLKTLGLAEPVSREGSPIPRMIMWSGKGKQLGEVLNGARAEVGAPSVAIKRGVLNRILREGATRQGVAISFGKVLRDIKVTDQQEVVATFTDGSSAQGDLLIGCDGIHSRTRRLIVPDAPAPQYTGLISTSGFVHRSSFAPTPNTQHFIFGKRAFFGYHIRSSGEVYWFVNFPQAQEPERSVLNQIESDEWQAHMLSLFRDDMPMIQEMIQATDSQILGYPIYDIATQPVWHRGPVVLVGDALHAVSPSAGQGASLALEDALVLAKCLRDIPDLEQAFVQYERLRRDRVERMVQYARSLGQGKVMTNPVQVWFRDLMMPFFLKQNANTSALDWVYSYNVEWDTSVI